jgi:hypothetical protein
MRSLAPRALMHNRRESSSPASHRSAGMAGGIRAGEAPSEPLPDGRSRGCAWDVACDTLRRRIRHANARDCLVALSRDGKTVVAADAWSQEDFGEATICLHDAETGEVVLTLEPGDDRADVLAFSPDSTRLLTGSRRGSAIV